jgi:hypothetical protein
MSPVCASCGSSLSTEDIFCGNCGRAAKSQAEQVGVPAPVPAYEPVPAAWFSLRSAPELDRARSGPVPPQEPDQRPEWEMSHDRRAGVAVQEERETGDMPWWESRVPLQAPPEPRPAPAPEPRPAPAPAPRPAPAPAPRSAAASQSYITIDDRKKSYAELGVPETLDRKHSGPPAGRDAGRPAGGVGLLTESRP